MKTPYYKNLGFVAGALIVLLQIFQVTFQFVGHFEVRWLPAIAFVCIGLSLMIDPTGTHVPKLSKIGYLKLALTFIAIFLLGFDLARVF